MDSQKVAQLRGFVDLLQAQPEVVHMPEMKFFKDFLVAWGATIPQPQDAEAPKSEAKKAGGCGDKKCEKEKATNEESDSAGEEEEIVTGSDSDIEVANEVELDEEPLELEDESTFPSAGKIDEIEEDADFDKQGELKEAAQEAVQDGKLDVAIAKLSEAMDVGSCSALMFAKRADLLLKAKRPAAALRDASAALTINENSAKALRVKGVIHRRLHEWAEARTELSAAQQMDYDDGVEETLQFVVKQAAAHDAHERDAKAQVARRELRHREAERKRRVRAHDKAKKNNARKATGARGFPGGMPGGFPGGMGGMPMPGGMPAGAEAAFSDPEIMDALKDPRVMEAISAMQSGDMSKFMALQSDPVLGPKIMKLMGSLGGAMGGGMPGGMGGMFGGMGGGMPAAGAPGGDANVEECD